MKRVLLSMISVLFLSMTYAQVPGTLSYQGILVDNLGAPVADGSHFVKFYFYNDPALEADPANLKYKSEGTGSGNQVTFKDVLNNLHILDYDYYFKVVDGLLTENHTQPLLILDEILKKGFDAHNFIVGLSEHLRNLLISQDARTINLMEVPDSIKKKYLDQVGVSSPSLLLSWLNIANQCDINYKSSKNQRLLVELALMKMAHIHEVFKGSSNTLAEAGLKKKLN